MEAIHDMHVIGLAHYNMSIDVNVYDSVENVPLQYNFMRAYQPMIP